ncbi:branched-chain amino acid aminotransferase [uncultured Rikenella sp.]|uniref:branched-chain amino acid aminotransferase n=1 Tax=uncultured Rikenella sp. TaxID=368003 RepID=UPI0026140867|nr:branched-chain amino acid aminotransferase [uncultured Rikenella sp.]
MKPEEIDWNNLKFGYTRTPVNVRCYCRDGQWGEIEEHAEETVTMHMAATALHYGQTAFEGLKAFRCPDGKVRVFRMDENARRMQSSAEYLRMGVPSVELFCEMVTRVVTLNKEYIPPYESGGSLYIRPVIVGSGPQLGVKPAGETLLLMFVSPVGPYYSGGMKGISAIVDRTHDRAAPFGTGHTKAGGNYGASLTSALEGHEKGYDSVLYLDPAQHRYIDECGAANFFGIRVDAAEEGGRAHYITPASHSILPSITNKSLRQIAADFGMEVEARQVELDELNTFSEAGCCGTAAVITPVSTIFDPADGKTYRFGEGVGTWSKKLYDELVAIQHGEVEDRHGWNTVLDL